MREPGLLSSTRTPIRSYKQVIYTRDLAATGNRIPHVAGCTPRDARPDGAPPHASGDRARSAGARRCGVADLARSCPVQDAGLDGAALCRHRPWTRTPDCRARPRPLCGGLLTAWLGSASV